MLTSTPNNISFAPEPTPPQLPGSAPNKTPRATTFAQIFEQVYVTREGDEQSDNVVKGEDIEATPESSDAPEKQPAVLGVDVFQAMLRRIAKERKTGKISGNGNKNKSSVLHVSPHQGRAMTASGKRGLLLANLSKITDGKAQIDKEGSEETRSKAVKPDLTGKKKKVKDSVFESARALRLSRHEKGLLSSSSGGVSSKYHGAEFTKEFKELAAKLLEAKTESADPNHSVKFDDEARRRILEQKITPLLKQLTQEGVKVEKIAVVKVAVESDRSGTGKASGPGNAKTDESATDTSGGTAPKINAQDSSDGGASGRNNTKYGPEGFSSKLEGNKDKRGFSQTLSAKFDPSAGHDGATASPGLVVTKGQEMVSGNAALGKLTAASASEAVQKVVELAEQKLNFGNNKLAVEVHVQNVGRISVEAIHHLGKIHIEMQVESNETRRMLQNHLRPFFDQMSKGHLENVRLDVSVRDHRQGEQQEQNFSQQGRRDESRFGESEQRRQEQNQRRAAHDVVMQRWVRNQPVAKRSLEIWA